MQMMIINMGLILMCGILIRSGILEICILKNVIYLELLSQTYGRPSQDFIVLFKDRDIQMSS